MLWFHSICTVLQPHTEGLQRPGATACLKIFEKEKNPFFTFNITMYQSLSMHVVQSFQYWSQDMFNIQ